MVSEEDEESFKETLKKCLNPYCVGVWSLSINEEEEYSEFVRS